MYRELTLQQKGIFMYILQKKVRLGLDLFFFIFPYYKWKEIYKSSDKTLIEKKKEELGIKTDTNEDDEDDD